jgi:formylmethanofuran dehydrogenase subunit A
MMLANSRPNFRPHSRIVSWLTSMPRKASISSTIRRLNGKRIASGIGDRQHSLDEFLDVEKSASVRQLGMALTTLLALADMTE